ncbi:MAG: 7-carboxy-7-deazaguanine synthase QueE [Bacteroidota bacterium]|nr:7-carboxy-7-deazaguanine synthase QueE [Bacteroidota bacterium]
MTYRINEIFYSLQGEGFWTGTPAVFVRFSGCNLRCPFCDTAHQTFTPMTAEDIISSFHGLSVESNIVILTGGEPGLQVDEALMEKLHAAGYRVHIETNGTVELPEGIDWVTLSPKEDVPELKGDGKVVLERADEIKVIYAEGDDPARWAAFPATWHFLQPCDIAGDVEASRRNIAATITYMKENPSWRLSLQTHKLLGIR